MAFRVWVLAAAGALAWAECSPVAAQPQPPMRPRNSLFGSVFGPGFNPPIRPLQPLPAGAGAPGGLQPAQPFLYAPVLDPTGQLLNESGGLPQLLPGARPLVDPRQRPQTGVAGTFNNLGHWYGGNLGHWYPNGTRGGQGVLAAGTTAGFGGVPPALLMGAGGGRGAGFGFGGPVRGGPGALLTTGALTGATINQFRR